MKKAFSKRYLDLWCGLITMLAAVLFYLSTLNTKTFSVSQIKPEMIPRITMIAMFILGVGIIIKWFIVTRRTPVTEEQEEKQPGSFVQRITAPVTFILIFLYIFSLKIIGFTTATTLYLTCQITLLSTNLGWKSWLRSLAVGVIMAVLIFLAFAKGFSLALPVNGLGF